MRTVSSAAVQQSDDDGNEVAGKVVVVTGAAQGIGHAVTDRLRRHGAQVVATDVDVARLDAAWREIEGVATSPLDVADPEHAELAAGVAIERFGRIDAVVNNAALHARDYNIPCLQMEGAQWQRLFDVNVRGPVNVARAMLPYLKESRGAVVNVASISGFAFEPPGAYAVSKAAVNALTVCLTAELGEHDVRVLGVAPGFIGTDVVRAALSAADQRKYLEAQAISQMNTPEELAEIIEFLLSRAARLLVGHTVMADAGFSRRP